MTQHSPFRQTVVVDNENGLHLIPCSWIAQAARDVECEVHVHKDGTTVDASNVAELLTLGAVQGTHLILEATGVDAEQAIARLVRLFESQFEVTDG